jgi:plastocyanin
MRVRMTAAAAAALIAIGALGVAGCGSSSSPSSTASDTSSTSASTTSSSGAGQTLQLSADPNGALKFDHTSLTAKAGKVSVVMTNPSSSGVQHGIAIEGNGVDQDGPIVQPGGTSTDTLTLKPGTYAYYCPFDSHKQQGMTGTLTVK